MTLSQNLAVLFSCLIGCTGIHAQHIPAFAKAGQNWWYAEHYDLNLHLDDEQLSLNAELTITCKMVSTNSNILTLDLYNHLKIDSAFVAGKKLTFQTQGNEVIFQMPAQLKKEKSSSFDLQIFYSGKLPLSKSAPWKGGIVSQKDSHQNTWLAFACQNEGAALWFPCKNVWYEKPQQGVRLRMNAPKQLMLVSNGQLVNIDSASSTQFNYYTWQVTYPIVLYNLTFYVGDYISIKDTFEGIMDDLALDYYVLRDNELNAKKHFSQVKTMLACFEEKLGPYPFYNDGYKLVEAPYLGMEHQSAIAYGNQFQNGYLGKDRSGSGVGLQFDFIIAHESGHEWFGNSITAIRPAEAWIHEAFTTYTETILAECISGKENAFLYQQGKKQIIQNDTPIIIASNEYEFGSGDRYDKGGYLVHTLRQLMKNDSTFFAVLKDMLTEAKHKHMNTHQIMQYFQKFTEINLQPLFRQYLYTTSIPVLHVVKKTPDVFQVYFSDCVEKFELPVTFLDGQGKAIQIKVSTRKQEVKNVSENLKMKEDYLIHWVIV